MEEIRISEDPNYVHLFSGGLDSTYGLLKLKCTHGKFLGNTQTGTGPSPSLHQPKGGMQEITEYIEIFYNRQRLQARLGFLSPVTFTKRFYARLLAA